MTERRVCLFGGSFNPPHVAHVLASAWALAVLPIDELWWVPTFQHAFKPGLAPFEERFALCEHAIATLGGRVRLCGVEQELGGESRTVDTLEALAAAHPDVAWSLLLGSDLLDETPRWKQWDRVRELARVFVLGREGEGGADASRDFVLPNLSSTDVREALREGRHAWLAARVPAAVLTQIVERGLYR